MRFLVLAIAASACLSGALPAIARAAPSVSCHCFRDRTFDPERPEVTDPYIRATTRNSLLSATFGVGKREIVQAEMTGTSPDDLWIAHWVAARTGENAEALLDARRAGQSWSAALRGRSAVRLGKTVSELLARGASDGELAALAVRDVITTRLKADRAVLDALESSGASTPDAILACVLSVRLRRPAWELWQPVRAGKKSWGTTLHEAGIAPPEMDAVVRQIVR